MNPSTIATASIATLKSFARENGILPTGDLRLKQTWIDAIEPFLAAAQEIAQETIDGAVEAFQEIATYDNAVLIANAANVITRKSIKFTVGAVWSALMVSLAVMLLLVEAFQSRQQVALKVREGIAKRVDRLVFRYLHLELVGRLALKSKFVQPVLDRRDRVRLLLRTAISN